MDLLSPEPDTPNKRRRLENPHEELRPDGIIDVDTSSSENFHGSPSVGEGVPSAGGPGGEEGVTRVNSDVEDVVQGGCRDEYDVHEILIIHTPNVSFVSNITYRKTNMSLIWEALSDMYL